MTLLVNAYKRDEAGKMIFLDPEDHAQELAGVEVFRKTFYGGRAARSLGLRLFPFLAEGDLYCEGDNLAALHLEADLISQNIGLFTEEAAADNEKLQFRINNILAAITRAQRAGGGVVIW
jgi:hypothetical protein